MTQPRVIQVTDQLERRIRKPIDALRSVTSCIWIFVLAVAAVAASATTTGVETDIVGASKRLPHALLVVVPPIALFALFILPAALAVAQVVRRQARTLAEAAATGMVAAIVAQVANVVLVDQAPRLYYAIIMSRRDASHINALDPYLAGLIAYTTIIGLSRRPGWRNTLTLAISVYVIVELTAARTTILAILITLLAGSAIGLAIRYGAGSILAASHGGGHRRGTVGQGPGGDCHPAGPPAPRRGGRVASVRGGHRRRPPAGRGRL